MYFSAKFDQIVIQFREYKKPRDRARERRDKEKVDVVRTTCLRFYQELCRQIKQRINHKYDLLQMLSWIDSNKAISGDISSLDLLYQKFQDAIDIDIELVNNEWRALPKEISWLMF